MISTLLELNWGGKIRKVLSPIIPKKKKKKPESFQLAITQIGNSKLTDDDVKFVAKDLYAKKHGKSRPDGTLPDGSRLVRIG